MKRYFAFLCVTLGVAGGLFACSRLPEPALPTLAPTKVGPIAPPSPTPPPVHADLIVCLAQEPSTLYLYGDTNREADTILQAIYDGPTDLLGFQPRPVILEPLPTFANGQARFETVSLRSGDIYLNPETDQPETLARGLPYLPAGCTGGDCIQSYSGGSVDMDRLVADFSLKAGVTWSDGQPLTAADSVFSYQLDGDPATPSTGYLFDRTYSYKAMDDQTVEWIGLPGFVDADYQSNFWSPLPKHILDGMTAEEVRTSDMASRAPIGWGPYQIQTWTSGEQIVLTPNADYWGKAAESKPFDRLIFRFLGDQSQTAIDQVKSGECDLLDETLLSPQDRPQLESAQAAGELGYLSVPGPLVMRLDLNLNPVGESQHMDLFSEVGTRRGLSLCIDRSTIVATVLNGLGEPADSYLPSRHPLYVPPASAQAYDPSAGQQLLDQAGWKAPPSGSGPRTALGLKGISDGTPLTFEVVAPTGELYENLGSQLASDLAKCGVSIDVRSMASSDLFASWPQGPVFGRTFQAVVWSWPSLSTPPCDMFASWEIPSDDHPFGSNASGFDAASYDEACRQVLLGIPDLPGYTSAVSQTQAIFQDQLPAMPLFVRPRMVAFSPWLCGVELDPSSPSVLWNIESLAACSPG
jgi:peptide/nickel transport system substrate-binding protein